MPGETCTVCGNQNLPLIRRFNGGRDEALIAYIQSAHSSWNESLGMCASCLESMLAAMIKKTKKIREMSAEWPLVTAFDPPILPTPFRLNAAPQFTGRGVTICFIDSGFYPHPDLTEPENRILAAVDLSGEAWTPKDFEKPHDHSWHGTMTSVVGCGNGYWSGGIYRGIASEANLVLLKVHDGKRIAGEKIAEAIRWAIAHRERYHIRIINLSVTDDWPISYKTSDVDRAVTEAVEAGITVVAAVGNDPGAPIKPPANSPDVIAVGGLDDHNTLNTYSLYHSSFGETVDHFVKPDLIAPSIWLAAPILPGTPAEEEAEQLYVTMEGDSGSLSTEIIKAGIRKKIIERKFITPHYQHADGTSFAAPIVCSVIAQMLEANPELTPAEIRRILVTTAVKLKDQPAVRQGSGLIHPKAAVEQAVSERHNPHAKQTPVIDAVKKTITFLYHDHHASRVAVAGDFNSWTINQHVLYKQPFGLWKIELPLFQKGQYQYKFVINNQIWKIDPYNPFKVGDQFNDFNSTVTIS